MLEGVNKGPFCPSESPVRKAAEPSHPVFGK